MAYQYQAARAKSGDSAGRTLPTTCSSSSIASASSDSDIEGGYSSREECDDSGRVMVSKFRRSGSMTRRLSQCAHLSHRPRTPPESPRPSSPRAPHVVPPAPPIKSIQFRPSYERQNSSSRSRKCAALALALVVAAISSVVMLGIQYRELSNLRQELEITKQHRRHVEKSRTDLLIELADREQSLEQYKHTHDHMQNLHRDMASSMRDVKRDQEARAKEMERLKVAEKRADFAERRWDGYVERIREDSRRSVLERFGKGPHRVELRVQLPASSSPETIRVELAPLTLMPHSVHTFLQQVHQGAWDGAAFDAHHGHVLMARGPDQGAAASSNPAPTLLFPEYSSQYPHDKYTLAFPGRPASSPDFYINMQPNSVHHSPRIQGEEFVEGEPCFGRIVDETSRRVVDRMDALSAGHDGRLEEHVTIVSARIIGS